MATSELNRRRFLQYSAAAGTGLLLSGVAPKFSAPKAADTQAISLPIKAQKKALVFIMLDGGNDSFNMLVPRDQQHYREYQKSRGHLALAQSSLVPLHNTQDSQGRQFALHPSLQPLQALYDNKQLSFIANIGPLIEPVSKMNYFNNSARLPLGLLSHADQFKHWQTSRPQARLNQGWLGFMADNLQAHRNEQQIAMNISLSGSNIAQNGIKTSHYSITQQGSVGLVINQQDSALSREIFDSYNRTLKTQYPNDPFKQTYLAQTREAQAQHETFRKATEQVPVATTFSDTALSQQLRKVAQSIYAADQLNLQQQTFFVRYIGWDHHDELLNNHAKMLTVLANGLSEFQTALQQMQIADQVVTFTGSDFGRTLTSNGNGTDHGWGGNTLVMGNAINGGHVLGDYPSLALGDDNPLDIGNGVLIPTLSTDALYAQLAQWFGVPSSHLHLLLPNLNHFKKSNCPTLLNLFKETS